MNDKNKYYKKWYSKEDNREKRLAYLKEWRRKNKERIQEYQQEYNARKARETMQAM